MGGTGNSGANKLARSIDGRISRNISANKGMIADFGVIQEDGSLMTNSFDYPIPNGEYTVLSNVVANIGSSVVILWIDSEPVVVNSIGESMPEIPDLSITESKIADAAVTAQKVNLPFHILV